MKPIIILKRCKGYKWHSNETAYTKGYIYNQSNEYVADASFYKYSESINSLHCFLNEIPKFNGHFSIIKIFNDGFAFAVDRLRVYPLFYFSDDKQCYISDDPEFILPYIRSPHIDNTMVDVFHSIGATSGDSTLIKHIKQVQPGEIIYFKNSVKHSKKYFSYYTLLDKPVTSYTEYRHQLKYLFEAVFERLFASLNNRTVVVPLSGGFDSRLIVTMLKKAGINNVLCITYGKKDNFELNKSQKVAQKLGYKWKFIEYNSKISQNYLNTQQFNAYYRFCSSYSSMFYLQEYFAIDYLKKEQFIPNDAVFIPGYSGDFIGGSKLSYEAKEINTPGGMVEYILKKHFIWDPRKKNNRSILFDVVSNYISQFSQVNYTIEEDWNFNERQAKYITNSGRVFHFFGHNTFYPYWDAELIDFFKDLPFIYKYQKKLFLDVLINDFFKPMGVFFNEDIHNTRPAKSPLFKTLIKKMLPNRAIYELLQRQDWMNYKVITKPLLDDLKGKGKTFCYSSVSYNANIIQWYCQQISEYLKNYDVN